METVQQKNSVPLKETLMKGIITIEELAEKMGVDPAELFSSLEAEKVPLKLIGKQVFLRIVAAKRYIMKPNINMHEAKNQQEE
jgi:hypothetical protein